MSNRRLRVILVMLAYCLALLSASPATAQKPSLDEVNRYRKQLRSTSPNIRSAAAYALGQIGSSASAAVPDLIKLLKDKDNNVRSNAIYALGQVGSSASAIVPDLIKLLEDSNRDVRENAAFALEEMGSSASTSVPILIAALKSDKFFVRRSVAFALGKMGSSASSAIPDLVRLLKDNDSDLRSKAVFVLGKMGSSASAAIPDLIELLKDKDDDVRMSAVKALGGIGSSASAAVPALIAALKDEKRYSLPQVADALGQIGSFIPAVVPTLIVALKDKDIDLRSHAAEALGQLGSSASAAVPALIVALKDKEIYVRRCAADALGNIGLSAAVAVPDLIKLLKDKEPQLRSSGTSALGKIGSSASAAVPALITALKDKESEVRSHAADALRKIGYAPSSAVPALITALKYDDPYARSSAADVLGNLGLVAKAAVPNLIELLKDKENYVRRSAASALRQIGTASSSAIPALIAALKYDDPYARSTAAEVLGNIGTHAKSAVPALISAIGDKGLNVSYSAIIALGKMRTYAAPAVPALAAKLTDPDKKVGRVAAEVLGNLGTEAKVAVLDLITSLKDKDRDIHLNAADAVRKIGIARLTDVLRLTAALKDKDAAVRAWAAYVLGNMGAASGTAVPTLAALLKDEDSDVRRSVAEALGNIGSAASPAVPELIDTLKDKNSEVRRSAVTSLGKIGTNGEAAAGPLSEVLADKDPSARNAAAYVLGRMGNEADPAIPSLIKRLNDDNAAVRSSALIALGEIFHVVQNSARGMLDTDLKLALSQVETIQTALRKQPASAAWQPANVGDIQAQLDNARTAFLTERQAQADTAKKEAQALADAAEKARQAHMPKPPPPKPLPNYVLWGSVAYAIVVVVLNTLLLVFWPLALLRINDGLKRYGGLRWQGRVVDFSLPFRLALGVGFLHYLPRVLDAWVHRYADITRAEMLARPTFKEREVYVDMPVLWQGESRRLTPANMQPLFAHSSAGLLLWGEGGSGKTTLVCQMALWALAENAFGRLCATHRMLPLFFEENLPANDLQGSAALRSAVQARLQQITGDAMPPSSDLVRHLLQKRRLLLIVDGISEMDAPTRNMFLTQNDALPLNALLVTSRAEEKLCSAHTETIQTRLIQWNQVSAFLWDYLGQRQKRDLFSRDEIYAALWRFSTLVGEREITALLARLYAQHMIDFKEQPSAEHPHSIPELMDAYINELCRKADNKQYKRYEIHQIARIAAWECLRTTYTPIEAPLDSVEKALANPSSSGSLRPYQRDPRAAIDYFADELHLLQKFGMDGSRLKFSLDPPSEYLAARHLVVTLYRDDVVLWDAFCQDAAARPNAPQSIAGFLIALRDTWEAFGAEGEVKEHVLGNMHRLFGTVLPDAAPTQASQGVSLWTSLLESSRKEDCMLALEELEKLGEAARDAIPSLQRTVSHKDAEVQERSAALLERLSTPAHAV